MSNEKTIINQEANKLQRPFEKLAALNVCVCVCVFVFIRKRQELNEAKRVLLLFSFSPFVPFHSIAYSLLFSFIFVHFIM